ncbi:MAG: toprim domain-containing protein [Methanogenium sp.]|jgi:DNA primase
MITHSFLKELGIEVEKFSNDNFMCHCPFHSDTHPSFSISYDGLWICFSCGRKGNVQTLLNLLGRPFLEPKISASDIACRLEYKHQDKKLGVKYYYDYLFYKNNYDHSYMESRGITQETANFFGLGYDKIRNGIIFPIYNYTKEFIGYSIRHIYKEPKYQHFSKKILYNEDKVSFEEPIYVVEGLIDVLKAHQLGIKNVVGVMGAFINEHQEYLLLRFPEIILGFDNDRVGKSSNIEYGKQLTHKFAKVKIIKYPYNIKDFGELTNLDINILPFSKYYMEAHNVY